MPQSLAVPSLTGGVRLVRVSRVAVSAPPHLVRIWNADWVPETETAATFHTSSGTNGVSWVSSGHRDACSDPRGPTSAYHRSLMKILGVILLVGALVFGATSALGVVDWAETLDEASNRALGVGEVTGDGSADSSGDGSGGSESSSSGQRKYIASVATSVENGTTRYHVRPAGAGRAALGDQLDLAWDQAVGLGVPDRAGLRQQFLCHPLSFVARAKPTWDLESWRPTVGLKRTILALCNPGQ
jgi:hypothetical protein